MKNQKLPFFVFLLFFLFIAGCQQKTSKKLEFDSYLCSFKDDKCFENPSIYKFKVRKFENQIIWNIFDSDGKALQNIFLKECEIFDRLNWKCKLEGKSVDMIDGELVTRYSEHRVISDSENFNKDYYFNYVPRK
jgi:hypothetical protein